jgi:uncharacterized protein YyaL (SSP411 family)
MMNLVKFYLLKSEPEYEEMAFRTINAFGKEIEISPTNYSFSLMAADILMNRSYTVVIVGDKGDKKTVKMIDSVMERYMPQALVILKEPEDRDIAKVFENVSSMNQLNNETTAYVCTGKICLPPFTDIVKIREALRE